VFPLIPRSCMDRSSAVSDVRVAENYTYNVWRIAKIA
jgi:hypothetical protein